MHDLTPRELARLVKRVFAPTPQDRALAVLVDLPDSRRPDHPAWRWRRELAAAWAGALDGLASTLGFATDLVAYRNVGMNNADLPEHAWRCTPLSLPLAAEALPVASAVAFAEILASHSLLIALTEFSATAPLKLAAKRFGFRAATMPGFSQAMLPALRLDYDEVNRRVQLLKGLLDRAERAEIAFVVGGGEHGLHLDLRHRTAHASGGLLTESGVAGNLPSGEAYIVPYEGEIAGNPSGSRGMLPVELEGEVVFYDIRDNRARAVRPGGPVAQKEAARLASEPAYGNLAELGLGVLAELGVGPCGDVLLDEKLGLHIAFGRSDHFGGRVGARDFSSPETVVHIDRVFVPEVQPRVRVARLDLVFGGGRRVAVMRDGRYVVDFSGAGG